MPQSAPANGTTADAALAAAPARAIAARPEPRRGPFYCVPLVACGAAILDFENHVLVFAGRRIFLTARKMVFLGILLASRGEPVHLARIADALGIADAKYPQHVIARLAREIQDQLRVTMGDIVIARGPKGYLVEA